MSRILMFGCKNPLHSLSPEATLERDVLRANSGNLLFSHSAYRSLASPGTDITVSDFTGWYDRAPWINRNFDHVVLPFANAFRSGFEPRLLRLTELVEKLRVPVTVLGIGAQSTADLSLEPLAPLASTVSRFMRSVLERSPSVGVRGEFTAHYLHTLGFTDVEVIGCPSMFLHGPELPVRARDTPLTARDRVAVTARRGDGPWMDDLLERTRADHPDLVYIPQAAVDLELMLWGEPGAEDVDRGVPTHLTHPMFREGRVRFFVDASPWVAYLADFDFCFGTRIHGNVAALLAGTPAHVVAHDSRTLELAQYFEIPYTPAGAVTPATKAGDLLERSDFRPLVEGHAARFARYVRFLDGHALPHALNDPAATAQFDQALSQVRLPPGVRPLTAEDHTELASRVHSLRELQQRNHRRASGRIAELEEQVRALGATAHPRTAPSPPGTGIRRRLSRLTQRVRR